MGDKVKYFEKHNPSLLKSPALFQKMMQIVSWRGTVPWNRPQTLEEQRGVAATLFEDHLETWTEAESADPYLPEKMRAFLAKDEAGRKAEEGRFIRSLSLKSEMIRQALMNMGLDIGFKTWERGVDPLTIVHYYRNQVYGLLRLYPGMVYNKKQPKTPMFGPNSGSSSTSVMEYEHRYWGFSSQHIEMIREKEAAYFQQFVPFVDDPDFNEFLADFMAKTDIVFRVFKEMPTHLFSAEVQQYLYMCLSLDVYHKYFECADRFRAKEGATGGGLEADDLEGNVFSTNAAFTLSEAIDTNRDASLGWKQKLIRFLRTCEKEEVDRYKMINVSYEEAEESSRLNTYQEKMGMIAMFNRMKDDERRVEKIMKKFKLGKWNVGKEVFRYDKNQFDKEMTDVNLNHMESFEPSSEEEFRDVLQQGVYEEGEGGAEAEGEGEEGDGYDVADLYEDGEDDEYGELEFGYDD